MFFFHNKRLEIDEIVFNSVNNRTVNLAFNILRYIPPNSSMLLTLNSFFSAGMIASWIKGLAQCRALSCSFRPQLDVTPAWLRVRSACPDLFSTEPFLNRTMMVSSMTPSRLLKWKCRMLLWLTRPTLERLLFQERR